jgi:hypothetical protein
MVQCRCVSTVRVWGWISAHIMPELALFAANYKRKDRTEGWKVETDGWQTWFWGLVLVNMERASVWPKT